MTSNPINNFAIELKHILENANSASRLDDHIWAKSLTVCQFVAENPSLESCNPGYQLLAALRSLFDEITPGTPPRRGKRLDTRWGQFGILGALYFAPIKFGTVRPATLVDAWGRIDEVILRFVYGERWLDLTHDEVEKYCLGGGDIEIAPTSTISNWHVRGLERLAEVLICREKMLSVQLGTASALLDPQGDALEREAPASALSRVKVLYTHYTRHVWLGLALIVVLLMGWKSLRVLSLYRTFTGNVNQLQALVSSDVSLESLEDVGPLLATTRGDILALREQVTPLRWVGRLLGWLPVYGGNLTSAGDLLDLAAGLVLAGDEAYQAGIPFLQSVQSEAEIEYPEMLDLLIAAQPRFEVAQTHVDDALVARAAIDIERLSPRTRPLVEKIDQYLPLLGDFVPALISLPKILGAAEYGPQTYLVLIQNEDEIRATGGFITAAVTITVENGEMIAFVVKDSYDVDDLTRQTATSPWQMIKFMGEPTLRFRNANWSPDFPTTAIWAEHLNAYGSGYSVDGVFTIGQEALRLLLTVTGPLEIYGTNELVTAENIHSLLRVLKDQGRQETGDRKAVIGLLADVLLEKLIGNGDLAMLGDVAQVMLEALDGRHILVQLDDSALGAFIASRGWDGAMQPGQGDYLMVVDSNVGWNKVNAVVQSEITYHVDLSDPNSPKGLVITRYYNPSPGDETCRHGYYYNPEDTYQDYIERCYWNYQRVYTLAESQLLGAQLHLTPPWWFYRGETVLPFADVLDNSGVYDENPQGLQGYGDLLVVPRGEERQTRFEFALPAEIVIDHIGDDQHRYQLHIQKQSGTLAIPVSIQVKLPTGLTLIDQNPKGTLSGDLWSAELNLQRDIDLTLMWKSP